VIMDKAEEITELLGSVDEVLCVGGMRHCQQGILFFLSPRRHLKFLHAKKEAQKVFGDKIN
jgi:hypothetical protein